MGSTFNRQILVEKLAKLNSSQTSIETLSHWCIFHMKNSKQVVETWAEQFHCSPREKKLAFLFLANDILQNSRRKGSEFVGEFWKVLPDSLRDVIQSGDDRAKGQALRLIGIWDERKVFGSRGQILKEEFVGRHVENKNRDVKPMNLKPTHVKLRPSAGNELDKIVSGYHHIYGGKTDEDAVLSKCRNTISSLEKADKQIGNDSNSGKFHGSAAVNELQRHNAILKGCIEQLTSIESSRASLVSHLRAALQDQESKLGQVRSQIQAARAQWEHANNSCQQLLNGSNIQSLPEQSSKEIQTSTTPAGFISGQQSAPLMYAPPQVPLSQNSGHGEGDPLKSAAAAVAAQLTASSSSAQMLSYVLSSLASEGVLGNQRTESCADYHSEKRIKLENDQSSYVPSQNPQQPLPPLSLSEIPQSNASASNQQSTPNEPPPPPPPSSSPPPLPPPPPMPQQLPMLQFMQTVGSGNMAYSYSMVQQPSMAVYPTIGVPMNSVPPFAPPMNTYHQSFQGSDGNYYNQSTSLPMVPISRE